jgi:hypothetical protein
MKTNGEPEMGQIYIDNIMKLMTKDLPEKDRENSVKWKFGEKKLEWEKLRNN